jgi:hypothetical protein
MGLLDLEMWVLSDCIKSINRQINFNHFNFLKNRVFQFQFHDAKSNFPQLWISILNEIDWHIFIKWLIIYTYIFNWKIVWTSAQKQILHRILSKCMIFYTQLKQNYFFLLHYSQSLSHVTNLSLSKAIDIKVQIKSAVRDASSSKSQLEKFSWPRSRSVRLYLGFSKLGSMDASTFPEHPSLAFKFCG